MARMHGAEQAQSTWLAGWGCQIVRIHEIEYNMVVQILPYLLVIIQQEPAAWSTYTGKHPHNSNSTASCIGAQHQLSEYEYSPHRCSDCCSNLFIIQLGPFNAHNTTNSAA